MSTLLDINDLIAHNAAVPENAYSIPELNACIINNGDGTGSLQIAGTIAPGSGDASAANQLTQIAQIDGALNGTTPLYVSDPTAENFLQSIQNTNINIDTNVQLSINQGVALGQPVGTLATIDANAALELANLNLSNTVIENNTTSINNSILDSFQLAVSNGQAASTLSVYDVANNAVLNDIKVSNSVNRFYSNVYPYFGGSTVNCALSGARKGLFLFAIDNVTGLRIPASALGGSGAFYNNVKLSKQFFDQPVPTIMAGMSNFLMFANILETGASIQITGTNPVTAYYLQDL